jgi:copper homeostasis protein
LRNIVKEACVEKLDEAILAEKNGANRIELCSRLDLDGLTPHRNMIKNVINSVKIPVKVMIRPRGGNFVYHDQELDVMKDDILYCKRVNVSGIVLGVLKEDKTVDLTATRFLSDIDSGLEITFHKAIDEVSSIFTELDRLKSIQAVTNILTSGGADSAMEGSGTLKELVSRYKGQLTIIAAGKITEQNIIKVHELTGAQEYHGRKIVGDLRPN